jgi:creatinine amidohydrolase
VRVTSYADAPRECLWERLRRPELEAARERGAVVVVPVGAIEQHGPHLPVNTDTNVAAAIALGAAQAVEGFPVLVTPPVWTGFSTHHMGFTGTITLRFETMVALIEDICLSIHHHGFERIVMLNGHGGNANLLAAVAAKMSERGPRVAVAAYTQLAIADIRRIGESAMGGMGHSCEMETSLELFLQPECVDMGSAVCEERPQRTSFFAADLRSPGSVVYPPNFGEDSRSGVNGDPTLATADKGRLIYEAAVRRLAQFLREYHDMKL